MTMATIKLSTTIQQERMRLHINSSPKPETKFAKELYFSLYKSERKSPKTKKKIIIQI